MKSLLLAASVGLCAAPAVAQPSSLLLPWSETAVPVVSTTPGRVTDLVLEPGESLVGEAAVAAGDTARWIIGQSESGAGTTRRSHVLVKPTAPGLSTNLILNTDRRTYRVELRSTASSYAASVSWRYPAGDLIALRGAPAPSPAVVGPAAAVEPAVPLERLNFGWRIEGEAPWKPERVFDDGRRVVIDFPEGAVEMPPLFELAAKGEGVQLLNYRVIGRRIVVDRLFTRGELRLGHGKAQVRVRLERASRP